MKKERSLTRVTENSEMGSVCSLSKLIKQGWAWRGHNQSVLFSHKLTFLTPTPFEACMFHNHYMTQVTRIWSATPSVTSQVPFSTSFVIPLFFSLSLPQIDFSFFFFLKSDQHLFWGCDHNRAVTVTNFIKALFQKEFSLHLTIYGFTLSNTWLS